MKKVKLFTLSVLSLLWVFSSFDTPPDMRDLSAEKLTLKVMCYNIHHASPPAAPEKIDLDAIANVINKQNPDLVALQEVDVNTQRSGPYNQATELGKKTGMKAYFFKAIDFQGGEYGVAILSRHPVTKTDHYPLPAQKHNPGEPRVLGTATIQLPGNRKILFACTHLEAGRDSVNRHMQITAITDLLKDVSMPVILAGDFNAAPGSEVVRILDDYFDLTCDPCEPTIPVENPTRGIDFIATSPSGLFQVKEHQVIPERKASDHLPIFAVLEANL